MGRCAGCRGEAGPQRIQQSACLSPDQCALLPHIRTEEQGGETRQETPRGTVHRATRAVAFGVLAMSDSDFIPPLHDTDTDDDPYAGLRNAAEQWKAVEQQRRNATMPEVDGRAPLVRDESDAEVRQRELREQVQQQHPSPRYILPAIHPSPRRFTGKVAKGVEAVKRVFTAPRPKAFALQFDRHAVLIDISDDMLTDEEIRA